MQSNSNQASIHTKDINFHRPNFSSSSIKNSSPFDQTYMKPDSAIEGYQDYGKIDYFYLLGLFFMFLTR